MRSFKGHSKRQSNSYRNWHWPRWIKTAGVTMVAALSACGGKAVIDADGSGGATTTSQTTSVTTANVTSSSSTGAGGSCQSNDDCSQSTFCDHPEGQCAGIGTCRPFPDGCDFECPGVCGCDGNNYCNTCEAHSLGIDATPCLAGPEIAATLFKIVNDSDVIVVRVWDPNGSFCVAHVLEQNAPSIDGISVVGPWGIVESRVLMADRDLCLTTAVDLQGGIAPIANGEIRVVNSDGNPGSNVCSLDMSIDVQLPNGNPSQHQFVGVVVENGNCI